MGREEKRLTWFRRWRRDGGLAKATFFPSASILCAFLLWSCFSLLCFFFLLLFSFSPSMFAYYCCVARPILWFSSFLFSVCVVYVFFPVLFYVGLSLLLVTGVLKEILQSLSSVSPCLCFFSLGRPCSLCTRSLSVFCFVFWISFPFFLLLLLYVIYSLLCSGFFFCFFFIFCVFVWLMGLTRWGEVEVPCSSRAPLCFLVLSFLFFFAGSFSLFLCGVSLLRYL